MLCLGVWRETERERERERERPGTKHNTIKGKIKQFLKGRIISKVIGGWRGGAFDEKKDLYARKKCRRNEGNINAKKKTTTTTCRLKTPQPRQNFSNASPLKISASGDG